MLNFLRKSPIDAVNNYSENIENARYFSKADRSDIEKILKRVFLTEDGKKALAYLQFLSTYKTLNYNASKQHLYYNEGQRAFVANIIKIIST